MPVQWKDIIVGTAGHVDHGKSSLIQALTGTDPDRLPEEKRRGMTIDLGFAHLCLENDIRLGFVDVPGHEGLIKNMLAGAGGIDAVLLVVAANESIMPQTREHFDICRLLGVRNGVVALSKSDLVEADALALVELEVRELLKSSLLQEIPIIATSATKGLGLDRLKQELTAMARCVPLRSREAAFRLPIDRTFTVKGFGTVVTGSLISGSIRKNDEVEIQPSGKRTIVRGIQTYGEDVDYAVARQRAALNLQSMSVDELARGMEVTAPARFHAVTQFVAKVEILQSSPTILKHRQRIRIHHGTGQTVGTVRAVDKKELGPGERGYFRFVPDRSIAVLAFDRLILRRISPDSTIGGAVVLDTSPSFRKEDAIHLPEIESGELDRIILAIAKLRGPTGINEVDLLGLLTQPASEIREAMRRLLIVAAEEPIQAMTVESFTFLCERVVMMLNEHHDRSPSSSGMSFEEVASHLKDTPFSVFIIESLKARQKIAVEGSIVRLSRHEKKILPEDVQLKKEVEILYRDAGLHVPAIADLLKLTTVGKDRTMRVVNQLVQDGSLIRVSSDLLLHVSALNQVKGKLAAYKKTSQMIDVSSFKELLGISRKYAIPLLSYLDREHITRRVGDHRIIQ